MFVWTMAHRGILTGENLRRRGWEGPHRCPLCLQEEETTDHLLLSCVYSKEVWQLALGFTFELPQEANILLQNWNSFCPFQTTKKGQISTLWRTLPKFILWKIWLERNNRIFRETKNSPAQVATKIKAYFGETAPYFCKVKNSKPLEPEEEHWIEHFNLKDQQQKQAATLTRKSGKSGRRSKISTIGRERKTSIFCSLTGPPKETQVRLVEEESWKAQ
jgi:hypothetical protein